MSLLREILSLRVIKEFLPYGVHKNVIISSFHKGIKPNNEGMPGSKHNIITFAKLNDKGDIVATHNAGFWNIKLDKPQYIEVNICDEMDTMTEVIEALGIDPGEEDPFDSCSEDCLSSEEGLEEIYDALANWFFSKIEAAMKDRVKINLKLVTDKTGQYTQLPFKKFCEPANVKISKLKLTAAETKKAEGGFVAKEQSVGNKPDELDDFDTDDMNVDDM